MSDPAVRLLAIVNPASGRGQAARRAQLFAQAATRLGAGVTLVTTAAAGDACELAAGCPADVRAIVSIGGDGTLNEILNGLLRAGRDIPVALFPQGTANVVARELGLPSAPEELAHVAVCGRPWPVDVGLANGRVFSLAAGVGFDAAVVRAVHENRSGAISYASYAGPMFRAFWNYPSSVPLCVRCDGETVCADARYVVIGNTGRYGGPFMITPDATMEDGLFDLYCLRSARRRDLLAAMAGALAGGRQWERGPSVCMRGRRVEVTAVDGRAVDVQLDGDIGPALPLVCEIRPRAVRLMIP